MSAENLIPKGARVRLRAYERVFATVTFDDGDRVTVLIDGFAATNSFDRNALEVIPNA